MKKVVIMLFVGVICLPLSASHAPAQASKVEKCRSAVKDGKYKWAGISSLSRDPSDWFGNVLVKPKNVNKRFMIQLSRRLKSEYCMAEKFQVVIFDEAKYANSLSMQDLIQSKGKILLMRGFYSFDRATGKDILEFSTKRGNPTTEVQIDLSK